MIKTSSNSKAGPPSVLTATPSVTLGKGVPPPVPPNKPAMSSIYKPLTAALKLGPAGAGAGVTIGSNDNGVAAISAADQPK